PHQGADIFAGQFPADFISEAIDQTRGWFYSLLAISTMLFGEDGVYDRAANQPWPHPYANCVVLGLVLGKDGQKLSKRKRNYDEPAAILEREGADALRWYFYSAQAPWSSARFDESAIAAAQREFLIRLYNVYSFFVIYANIDKFRPEARPRELRRSELDLWVLSELHRTIRDTRHHLERYDNYDAARCLMEFVDGLSNWYVRRSRSRFWGPGMSEDKTAAYYTLWECLTTVASLTAPFTPFFAETMYQNLVRGPLPERPESVHLCDYPEPDVNLINEELSQEMALVRQIVSLGRAARTEAKIKVRQPLGQVEIVLASVGSEAEQRAHAEWLGTHAGLIRDELNVKNVAFTKDADRYVEYQVKPNFKMIGPKFGRLAPGIKKVLAAGDPALMRRELVEEGRLVLSVAGNQVELDNDDVQISLTPKPGWTAAQGREAVVILSTEVTDELRSEGTARELIHHIQSIRKEMNLEYTDRIRVQLRAPEHVGQVCQAFGDLIAGETLAESLTVEGNVEGKELRLEGEPAVIKVTKLA
ncbi:MAG: class I tRNA ligase family protein, partial [Phycisphaerales bacterium]